jgi:hypothetical protein
MSFCNEVIVHLHSPGHVGRWGGHCHHFGLPSKRRVVHPGYGAHAAPNVSTK